ncbi:MAG: extracellular solute-binding protein [Candidatus Endonucleobacter sp. (ex Gigantidas childressi)]|nr:extracellular solute-binding protein [Candidatus Endonucleobacter sp. (ex Gigantidas childressi)]
MASIGTFDSLNPYIEKGTAASGIHLIYDSLMTQSHDEPFSMYPLIAESVSLAEDNSSITFFINKNARFHDGHAITAEDVRYTFNLLINKGSPFYSTYYGGVKTVEIINPLTVRFIFKSTSNQELPLIVSQLSILPKHFWEKKENNFEAANMTIPLGNGAYQISSTEAGKQITYKRVENYWAKDLPVKKGHHNIDIRRYDYYRDTNIAIEALKAGEYDIRLENVAKNWATAYEEVSDKSWQLKKETIKTISPKGMQGFAFNTRKPFFSNEITRRALIYAMDFEWLNRNLFYNGYSRSTSYFSNSDMEATGLPSKEELVLLTPFKKLLPQKLFTQAYTLPVYDGSGNIRNQLNSALILLRQAGWQLKNGILKDANQQPFEFELLLMSPDMERASLHFKKNLEKIGIKVDIRTVDVSQYVQRITALDFDMITTLVSQSSSPGNEQLEYWGSEFASVPGSKNLMGVQSAVVDNLIEHIIKAPSRKQLTTAVKALDRTLLWGNYIIPHWYLPGLRVVYSDKLKHPDHDPLYDFLFETWWVDSTNNKPLYPTVTVSSVDSKKYNIIAIIILFGVLCIAYIWRTRVWRKK